MGSPRSILIRCGHFSLVIAGIVGQAGLADGAEESESGRYVNLSAESSCSDVGDVEGHMLCTFELPSVLMPDNGEIAQRVVRGTIDYTKGVGSNQGHSVATYADGSTRSSVWEGASKLDAENAHFTEGTYKCLGGTGRFAGIECNGTWKSVPQKGGFTLGEYKGSVTLPD